MMRIIDSFNITMCMMLSMIIFAADSISSTVEVTVNVVSDYGAVGDGVTEDGAAIEAAIDYINGLGHEYNPTLIFPGGKTYVITGSSNFLAAEDPPRPGIKEGIKAITHDNVTVVATDAEFFVPSNFGFGEFSNNWLGDANGHFAQGFKVEGRNFKLIGGCLNGNLENRTITKLDPNTHGEEWGLFLGENAFGAEVTGATFSGWGSDSCYIYSQGVFRDCIFEKGRRCGVAVTSKFVLKNRPIVFERCIFRNNAKPYEPNDRENPYAGIDLESNGTGPIHAEFYNCLFKDNYSYGLILSLNAKDILVNNCVLRDMIGFGGVDLGGAVIEGNIFIFDANDANDGFIQIYNVNDVPYYPNQPPCIIGANVFRGLVDAIKFEFSNPWPDYWKMNNNILTDSNSTLCSNLQGTGHITEPIIQGDSTLSVSMDWDGSIDDVKGFGNVELTYYGSPAIADELEAASKDIGFMAAAFATNFAFDTINVGDVGLGSNGKLKLTDISDDHPGANEAVYTFNLNVTSDSELDLNGINLYYINGIIDGAVTPNGGQLIAFNPADCNEVITMGFAFEEDLNKDCKVNFADFSVLAGDWMTDLLD